ncbi:MAG TPA: CpsB/CapC family capsule biosynthesis tyrosine phosphatase [Tepidisphaeraceae bacterium]|jgi:protein-tyrosine phosphatase|nr:CpsB/CapC family capsule biosynthesis tyrosine phosphatase [Tepidisphaeraceae bacterium]
MLSRVTGRIDVHSHLLPNVDDGCASLFDSLACARMMVDAGYSHSFCTPHIWPSLPANTPANIPGGVADLQRAMDDNHIPLTLIPGGELNMTDATARLARDEIVTYGMRQTHVLIDLWAESLPAFFEKSVRHLQSFGLTVILAHPERMRAVQQKPELADYFAKLGLLLQCNLQCLGDPPHASTRQVAERYLQEHRYFMFGSDLHNLASLPLRLRGLERGIELVGEEKAWEMTRDNPKKLLPAEN